MENNIEQRSQWELIFKRIQQASRQKSGVVMIHFKMFAKDGRPLFWLAPEVEPIEPRVRVTPDVLFGEMSNEQLQAVLEKVFR